MQRRLENNWIVLEYGSSRVFVAPVQTEGGIEVAERPDETMAMVVEEAIRKAVGIHDSSGQSTEGKP